MSSSSTSASSPSTSICQLCTERPQKYCCPRCNILYCSVDCYKSPNHSQCSETFYKECVVEEMAMQSAYRNQKCGTLDDIPGLSDDIKRMYAMLKRMESNDSTGSDIENFDIEDGDIDSDDEEVTDLDLTERLNGIDLNNADAIWSKLTSSEKQEFEKLVQNDEISQLLPPYDPWWTKKKLIEDITEPTANQTPEIMKDIADFTKISSKLPADCVRNNLRNVLAAYVLTVRFFNGEHSTNVHEFSNYLLATCANLKSNSNFDDAAIAVESVIHDCRNEGLTIDESQAELIRSDVQQITGCAGHVLAALSDIHEVLSMAKKNKFVKRSAKPDGDFSKRFFDHEIVNFEELSKTKLSCSIKKIKYYLSVVDKFRENILR